MYTHTHTHTLGHTNTSSKLSSVRSRLIGIPRYFTRTHGHDVDTCSLVCTDKEELEGISEYVVKSPAMSASDSYVNGSHMGVTNELCSDTNN